MIKLKNKRRNCHGMTLVELIVVMAILSVVMLAVMSLYVPAHQSTVAQTQVTDVQDNLRLGLRVMTRDLLTAGFLVGGQPIAFSGASPGLNTAILDDIGTRSSTEFIIRTRLVGDDFARISSASGPSNGMVLSVWDGDMANNFPTGANVRIFDPLSALELEEDPVAVTSSDRAYTIVSTDSSAKTITINASSNPSLAAADIPAESVLVKVKDENEPTMNTIYYRFDATNKALVREVNGVSQTLLRNIESVSFSYLPTSGDLINHIEISLVGTTKALKNDTISGEKKRAIKTSVKLRNVI